MARHSKLSASVVLFSLLATSGAQAQSVPSFFGSLFGSGDQPAAQPAPRPRQAQRPPTGPLQLGGAQNRPGNQMLPLPPAPIPTSAKNATPRVAPKPAQAERPFKAPLAPNLTLSPMSQQLLNTLSTEATIKGILRAADLAGGSTMDRIELLQQIYQAREYQPAFVSAAGPNTSAIESLRQVLISRAPVQGLEPNYYWTAEIKNLLSSRDLESLTKLEVLLVNSLAQYASDISTGRVTPGDDQDLGDIELAKRRFTNARAIADMASNPQALARALAALEPTDYRYKGLENLMARLLKIQAEGGFQKITIARSIKPNDSDPAVPLIRKRLIDIGLLGAEELSNQSMRYDFIEAIQKFQEVRMRVTPDGVIGQKTIGEINTSVQSLILQVRANMERWRLLPRDLGERYIMVDLGRQDLDVFDTVIENGVKKTKPVLWMRVVVGKDDRLTPTMINPMWGITFRPYWNTPDSLAVKDTLGKIEKDPNYLFNSHTEILDKRNDRPVDVSEIYPYLNPSYRQSLIASKQFNRLPFRFRQMPGRHNALGVLKFELHNKHAIYLHDTNSPDVFNKASRFESSGCIRVQRPFELAEFLIRNQRSLPKRPQDVALRDYFGRFGFNRTSIDMVTRDEMLMGQVLNLDQQIRVYIVGFSIGVDQEGVVAFSKEAYGQDQRIIRAMNGLRSGPAVTQASNAEVSR